MSFSVITFSSLPDGGQIQSTDIIAIQRGNTLYKTTLATSNVSLFPAVDITAGQALTINGSGQIIPAQANASGTSNVIGFAQESVTVASALPISFSQTYASHQTSLTIGSYYYLSASTPGAITATIPGSGNYLVPVGVAIKLSTIFINIGHPTLIP